MAKFAFDVAVAFAAATEGTYDSTLDGITTSLSGDPDGTDQGLMLGDAESGIGSSGLSFAVTRGRRPKAFLGASYTRPLADFLKAEVSTFSFAFPFCGSRRTTTPTTPVDGDFIPLTGFDAVLQAAGLVGAAWGAGVGHRYTQSLGTAKPASALVYYFGNRLELQDCRCTGLSIVFTPGNIPIATADFEVGLVKDPAAKAFSVAALPSTLDYGAQATVSAPTVEGADFIWQDVTGQPGFQSLTLNISPSIATLGDSNVAVTGEVKEPEDLEITVDATLFSDDTSSNEVFELDQILATVVGDLNQLSFTIGDPETAGSLPAKAVTIIGAQPEVTNVQPVKLGSKSGNTVSMTLGHASTGGGELEIIFE